MRAPSTFFIILLSTVVFLSGRTYGQSTATEHLPLGFQSPTAASLGEYGAIPVSKYTGLPQIKIPLYEAGSGDLILPISLSYHAGGIKVDEIAGWVGLGWSLNAGGVITRTVRGTPDETGNGYLSTVGDVESGWPQPSSGLEDDMKTDHVDTQPDKFFFNIGGVSGTFMFAGGGQVVQFPRQDMKIDFQESLGELEFTLTNNSGVRYIFEPSDTEETFQPNSSLTGAVPYVSSWYLTRIESPQSNNTIDLYYTSSTSVEHRYTSSYMRRYPVIESGCPTSVTVTSSINKVITESIYLSRIETRSETIYFDTSFRQDALDPVDESAQEQKLDKIRIERNGTSVGSHEFSYSYFNPSSGGVNGKRLRLDAVTQKGSDGSAMPPHQFTYSSTGLPSRTSQAIDHWGFYNGATNSGNLIPDYVGSGITYTSGADREANPSTMQAGILTEIQYPTGGTTGFVFEPHEFSKIGNNSVPDEIVYNNESSGVTSTSSSEETTNLTLDFDQTATLRYSFDGPENTVFSTASIELRESGGQVIYSDAYNQQYVNQMQSTDLELDAGNYVLAATGGTGDDIDAYINLLYLSKTVTPITNKTGGGLRVKQIEIDEDADSQPDQTITYSYHEKGDTGTSSGVLTTNPVYFGFTGDGGINDVCAFQFLQSTPKIPLGVTQGSFVGYRQVKLQRAAGEGYSWFHYKAPDTVPDLYIGGDIWPFETLSKDWKRGYLEKEQHYHNNGQKLSEKTYTYTAQTYNADLYSYLYRVFEMPVKSGSPLGEDYKLLRFDPYQQTSAWLRLDEVVQKTYDPGGSGVTSTTRSFSYQSPTSATTLQPESVTETNSDGGERTTEYEYAHQQYSAMQSDHMLTQPYKVTVRDNSNSIIRIDWTLWDTFNTGSDVFWYPCEKHVGGDEFGTTDPAECN